MTGAGRGRLGWISAAALVGTALAVFPTSGDPREVFVAPKAALLAIAAAVAAAEMAFGGGAAPPGRRAFGGSIFGVALAVHGAASLASLAIHGRSLIPGLGALVIDGAALVLFLAARAAVRADPRHRDRLQGAVVLAATLVALLAVLEALGLALPWDGARRPISSLGNRNFVGAYVALALPLAWSRAFQRPRLWLAVPLTLLPLAVALSRCRSAWLGLLVAGALALALWATMRPRPALTARAIGLATGSLVVALGAAAGLPWPGLHWGEPAPLSATLGRLMEYQQGSGRARVEQHLVGLASLRGDPLLGVGPLQWNDAALEHAHAAPGLHAAPFALVLAPNSDLVRVGTERGLLGLAALCTAIGALLLGGVRDLRRGEAPRGQLAVLASLTVAGVHGLFDCPLFLPWSAAAIAVLAGTLAPPRPVLSVRAPRWLLRGSAALAIALLCGFAVARTGAALAILGGGDPVAALRAAQRWYPRPEVNNALVARLGNADCRDFALELAAVLQASPHQWGVLRIAARCADRAGDPRRAATLRADAHRIEPHDMAASPPPSSTH